MLENILKSRATLTASEIKVQKYITENPNRIEMLTINKLSANAGVSVASTTRFIRKLGFSGFKEFKYAFLNELTQEKSPTISSDKITDKYINNYIPILRKLKNINTKELDVLAEALLSHHMNYILGVYYSSVPARLLSLQLQDMNLLSFYAGDYTDGEHMLGSSNSDSTIVLFSINGTKTHYAEFWGDAIKTCKNTFLITLNKNAELKNYFKHTIVLPGNDLSHRLPTDPESLPIIFIEILMQIIYRKHSQRK